MEKYEVFLKRIYGDNYSKKNIIKKLNIFEKEGYPYILEEHYLIINFETKAILIPFTSQGENIITQTINFINDLGCYRRDIRRLFEENEIRYFRDIVNSYCNLRIEYLDEENKILIFNSIKNYKFETELSIYNFAKIEILLKILPYDIDREEVKQLVMEDVDITPIIFPIKKEVDFFKILNDFNSLKKEVDLFEIIKK